MSVFFVFLILLGVVIGATLLFGVMYYNYYSFRGLVELGICEADFFDFLGKSLLNGVTGGLWGIAFSFKDKRRERYKQSPQSPLTTMGTPVIPVMSSVS